MTRPLAIVGPTGTGKSQLALDVAERLGGEIVNADAMQLYRGMDIGTAKLPVAERRGIPHHQLDVLDVTETASVARYQQGAAADIEAIMARAAVPIVVGGSMLYVQSLLDDWSFPATDAAVRAKWEQRLADVGAAGLHAELASRDPAAAAAILPSDGRRIVRALEVLEVTGGRLPPRHRRSVGHAGTPSSSDWIATLQFSTSDWPTHRHHVRVWPGRRSGRLAQAGLRNGVTASRALGYAQVIAALDAGGTPELLDDARRQTYLGTRRYVRRQRSWFRRDHRIHWIDAAAPDRAATVSAVLAAWRHVS
ncbi:tRNA dimethylallyltransferase [Mycobacterium xenopi 4042]|uniref:tRNA dimethylallyltransferase n=1 Tax=Mycobacterium xenopi 4042 TaxID=1299334 RepID=X8CDJ0_MYCXE|nr:tRNA dimethylallyltransferase [Mycobacterium xenopi 4042]